VPAWEQFNEFLKPSKDNGVFDDMVKRWMITEGSSEHDIGLKLIQSRSAGSRYKYENGKNILSIKVKRTD
jgi:hypothetical protein